MTSDALKEKKQMAASVALHTNLANDKINKDYLLSSQVVQKKVMSSDHIVIILTIFCVTLFALCFSCVYRCARKLKADHHVYQV